MNPHGPRSISALLRDYDSCFAAFLRPSGNGQKILQAILLRAAFRRFAERQVAIRRDAATAILDVSCGPGDFSVAWTSEIAEFLPLGMIFYCTDHASGVSRATGEKYTAATANKIRAAAQSGRLFLAEPPIAIDADLFFGGDGLMPRGRCADIIHWSHSGYHVRDALGPRRDDPAAVAAAMDFAIEKMWAALDVSGLMLSVHQTRDISDGVPSQMLPVAREYCGSLDNVPELIEERVNRLGGAVATVNFASPLYFATTGAADWEALKQPARWHLLGPAALRNLLLLNFIAYDFGDRSKAGLEKLAENGTLASYIDAFRSIVEQNQGFILVKCGFQMTGKSKAVAGALDDIAGELRRDMPEFRRQMIRVMEGERGAMPDAAIDVPGSPP